ncbi:hypothetical protein ACFLZW_01735 [Chloroflexota bacterium]
MGQQDMTGGWQTKIIDDRVLVGERFMISFQRTLRLPDDGKPYPLPPTLGLFPVKMVVDYAQDVPPDWSEKGGVFFPMYQREAMWLAFETTYWKPNAVKIGVGGINAITGEAWQTGLDDNPQNYLVCPEQPWLDGINAGEDIVRQFVAMPLGMGYTVEGQLTGRETVGGFQILVYDPKTGLFPDKPPGKPDMDPSAGMGYEYAVSFQATPMAAPAIGMGMAAGGQMKQKLYPDPHGLNAWDQESFGELFVHIVNSEQYQAITGEMPPQAVVDAQTYSRYGFPWFELYDEAADTLAAADKLSGVSSVRQLDEEQGLPVGEEETPVIIKPGQITEVDRQDKQRK